MRTRSSAQLRRTLLMAICWACLLFLFLPVLVVIPVSLTDKTYLSLPEHGVSLQHYASVAEPENGWMTAMGHSLIMAITAAIVSTMLAAAFSIGAWVKSGWWPSAIRILMLSPMIVPPIIYAVGMVRVLSGLRLMDTFIGVLTVHVILGLPMALLAIAASLSNFDNRVVLAARSLGAGPFTIFAKVILPNIVPGLGAAAFLAFITSWDEITVTLFITARNFVTLPRRIYTSIADSIDPALASIATILLLVTVVVLVGRLFFTGKPKESAAK
ncbi:MAG: ABC transporter permease [Rhodobacteraceae bacterium]|nr:ABC transporter permease [Paracoccaceae bacterium]MAY47436.1 ABC transporter permease [Paracoccaceae bacterium]QEW19527.1 Inner membrane ABC transporter permease protein YdcV [Marinibacterium anthonyi]